MPFDVSNRIIYPFIFRYRSLLQVLEDCDRRQWRMNNLKALSLRVVISVLFAFSASC